MKLIFKQRLFSWIDSYDIFDEDKNVLYTVQGKMAWGHCLEIFDPKGDHVGTVKEEVFSFLPRFRFYIGEDYAGEIRKEMTVLRPSFRLDYKGWCIKGNMLEWEYRIEEEMGGCVASLTKKPFHLTDTYMIDVEKPENTLIVLMAVLAIDAAKCSLEQES